MAFRGEEDATYVVEGVETALRVKQMAIQSGLKNIQVLASLGKENLRQISHIKTANKVVLALDNDGVDWQQDQKILDIKREIESQGRVVECMQPAMVGGKKTDFNDIKSFQKDVVNEKCKKSTDLFCKNY